MKEIFAKEFIDFIDKSPSSYHAVKNCSDILDKNGFVRLDPSKEWKLEKNGKYYTRFGGYFFAHRNVQRRFPLTARHQVGQHAHAPLVDQGADVCIRPRAACRLLEPSTLEILPELRGFARQRAAGSGCWALQTRHSQ